MFLILSGIIVLLVGSIMRVGRGDIMVGHIVMDFIWGRMVVGNNYSTLCQSSMWMIVGPGNAFMSSGRKLSMIRMLCHLKLPSSLSNL